MIRGFFGGSRKGKFLHLLNLLYFPFGFALVPFSSGVDEHFHKFFVLLVFKLHHFLKIFNLFLHLCWSSILPILTILAIWAIHVWWRVLRVWWHHYYLWWWWITSWILHEWKHVLGSFYHLILLLLLLWLSFNYFSVKRILNFISIFCPTVRSLFIEVPEFWNWGLNSALAKLSRILFWVFFCR